MNEEEDEWLREDFRPGMVMPGLPVELENMLGGAEVMGLQELKAGPITLGEEAALFPALLEVVKFKLNWDGLPALGEGFGRIGTTDLEEDLLELELLEELLPLLDFLEAEETIVDSLLLCVIKLLEFKLS